MTDPKAVLASLGWRVDTPARLTQAVKDFQGAWNLGPALTRDGELGPSTRAALEVSILSKAAGGGDISENFNAREFACNCGGKWDDCRRIWINRNVIRVAEQYRTLVGPFTPARACRCPRENARVGGVSNSQHLYGLALDLPVYEITQADVQHLGTVSGIGIYYWQGRGYVRHVDLRHLRGSTSKPSNPATWNYGNAKSAPLTPAPAAARPTPTPTSEEDDMPLNDADKAWISDAIKSAVKVAVIEMQSRKEKVDRQSGDSFWLLVRQASVPTTSALTALASGIGPQVTESVKAALDADYEANITLTKKESQ